MSPPDMPEQPPLWSRAGITLRWRGDMLFLGKIYIGQIGVTYDGPKMWADMQAGPSAVRICRHATEAEARTALVDAAVKALMGEDS